jgi:tetratricopeptide (TPR) repeat protein
MKTCDFEGAIICFHKCNTFFTKHKILNKYGSIISLNPLRYTYKELTLAKLAYSYSQKGDRDQAQEYLKECLALNPKDGLVVSTQHERSIE